jgi:RNA polymerase sigma-70 factor, ECF subfamily
MTTLTLIHGEAASDAELVERFRGGDERAFEELARRHRRRVRSYVARLLHDGPDVDDVLQDVFISAWVHLRRDDRSMHNLRAWLLRVARNRVIDLVRAARPVDELREEVASPRSPLGAVEVREELRSTIGALHRLPPAQRRALVLNAVEGSSYAEVGRALGVSPEAAKALAFRGRASARRALAATGGLAA